METPLQQVPTTRRVNSSTSAPTESSTLINTTMSSVGSPLSHFQSLAESCLQVMTITTVMSGIRSRASVSGCFPGTIIGLVAWACRAMESRSVPEAGTRCSRLVLRIEWLWWRLTIRSGRSPLARPLRRTSHSDALHPMPINVFSRIQRHLLGKLSNCRPLMSITQPVHTPLVSLSFPSLWACAERIPRVHAGK